MKSRILISGLLIIFIYLSTSFAQGEEPLVTDRPDATESAVTVGTGTLQIETGFIFEQSVSSLNYNQNDYHIATTLIRTGIGENFEFRFHGKYHIRETEIANNTNTISGLNKISIGMKYHFYESGNGTTNGAVLAGLFLPVGNSELRPSGFEPALLIALSNDFSDMFSVGTNFGGIYLDDSDEVIFPYTLVLGISLSERLGGFVELFGALRNSTAPEHFLDGGLTYLINYDIQLDVSAGARIFFVDANWFINSGISVRFPK